MKEETKNIAHFIVAMKDMYPDIEEKKLNSLLERFAQYHMSKLEQSHKELEYKLKEEAHLATMTDNLQRELALNWCIELLESNNTNNE